MSCDRVRLEELLPMRGRGRGAETAVRHLAVCPRCRERLRVMVCVSALKREPRRPAAGTGRERWLAVAAAVVGLILLVASPPQHGPASALSTRAAYPRFLLQTRSREIAPDARELGLRAYQAGNFHEAVARLSGRPLDAEASFFLGVSLYLTGRPDEALPWLRGAEERTRWRRPALWYRANALLATGRTREARGILESLARGVGEFRHEAATLLERPQLRSAARGGPR